MELIERTGRRTTQPTQEDLNELLYFVPLDFSAVSYHALHYAVQLAKESGGGIHLYHVADIRDVSDSDNPLVVQRSLEQLEKRAATRLDSLKEIIQEAGVQRVTSQVELGNVKNSLYRQIVNVHPDIVILGRKENSSRRGSLASYLLRYSAAPLLFVPTPFNGNIFLTRNSLFVSDVPEQRTRPVRRYFCLAQRAGQQLSVMKVGKTDVLRGLRDHLANNSVDLICAMRRKPSLWKRMVSRNWMLSIVRHVNVPILLIDEGQDVSR